MASLSRSSAAGRHVLATRVAGEAESRDKQDVPLPDTSAMNTPCNSAHEIIMATCAALGRLHVAVRPELWYERPVGSGIARSVDHQEDTDAAPAGYRARWITLPAVPSVRARNADGRRVARLHRTGADTDASAHKTADAPGFDSPCCASRWPRPRHRFRFGTAARRTGPAPVSAPPTPRPRCR